MLLGLAHFVRGHAGACMIEPYFFVPNGVDDKFFGKKIGQCVV